MASIKTTDHGHGLPWQRSTSDRFVKRWGLIATSLVSLHFQRFEHSVAAIDWTQSGQAVAAMVWNGASRPRTGFTKRWNQIATSLFSLRFQRFEHLVAAIDWFQSRQPVTAMVCPGRGRLKTSCKTLGTHHNIIAFIAFPTF